VRMHVALDPLAERAVVGERRFERRVVTLRVFVGRGGEIRGEAWIRDSFRSQFGFAVGV